MLSKFNTYTRSIYITIHFIYLVQNNYNSLLMGIKTLVNTYYTLFRIHRIPIWNFKSKWAFNTVSFEF